MNQDDMMFEYLLQMGAMRPEEVEMMRKQKQIDALRGGAMEAPQGQMVGKHYVAPSLTQYAAQLGQGYMSGQAQKKQDEAMRGMNEQQKRLLENLRRKRQIDATVGGSNMYSDQFMLPTGDGLAY